MFKRALPSRNAPKRAKADQDQQISHSTLILLVEHLEKAKKSASKLNFIMVMKSWKKPVSGWSRVLGSFGCSKPQWQQMGLNVPGAPLCPWGLVVRPAHSKTTLLSIINTRTIQIQYIPKTQMTLVVKGFFLFIPKQTSVQQTFLLKAIQVVIINHKTGVTHANRWNESIQFLFLPWCAGEIVACLFSFFHFQSAWNTNVLECSELLLYLHLWADPYN